MNYSEDLTKLWEALQEVSNKQANYAKMFLANTGNKAATYNTGREYDEQSTAA